MDLFRLKSVLAWTVLLSGALTLAACGDDPDAGAKDNGVPTTDPDGGVEADSGEGNEDATVTDRGRNDLGRVDMGMVDPCPNGTEGCECTSTATAAKIPFEQEDCQAGLLCVHWDLISGLRVGGANPELEGPVKSCVKPCQNDGECGTGRTCANLVFTAQTGAEKICVDKVAGFDEFCSGSRLGFEQVSDPAVMDGVDEIIACEAGLACQLFQFGDSFNPDEALCMSFCNSDTDCTNGMTPYCNPRFFTTNSTTSPFVGVCSDAAHPNGAICGTPDPDKVFRVSTACDTSEATCGTNADACPVCVGINFDQNNSLTPDRTGICMSPCTNMTPCFGNRTCIPDFFNPVPPATVGDGVCSDGCTATPDKCPGPGSLNHGQDCLELVGGAAFCVDRYTPALAAATFDSNGQLLTAGGNCTGDFNNYSFFSCPDGATCLPQQNADGLCLTGCTPNDSMFGTDWCRTLLNSQTATCTEPQAGFGVCGDG